MAKQTRLATTLTARYFPTAELTDAFYMDGRVTSKTVARSADLTNDKEDRGFFFSVFSHQTIADQDPNALPPYEPILRRLGTELKTGRRSLDDSIGEMVNTAVSITGKMKIQQDNSRAPFFAGVMVKDGEAFASTIGKGLAFLYRDDTLYPMTATDIRIDAINTARQKVENFYNFCATKTAPALCSNIAQLKLDDCIILCNREVYEALGQQELLRILYDAEDQSDAASVVITEAAAKLPGVPLQFMISFVEDITSSDRGGFFGFGRKKKKVVEEDYDDDYNVAPQVPLESPEKEDAPLPKDAMLFGDDLPKASTPKPLETTMVVPPAGSAAAAIASLGAETAASTAAKSAADAAVEAAINTPVPEPPLSFGDISDLMKEEGGEKKEPENLEATKVMPFVNSFDKAAAELDAKTASPAKEEAPAAPVSPFVQPAPAPAVPEKKDEPFVAVKNADNPFAKAALQAQAQSAPIPEEIVPKAPVAGAVIPEEIVPKAAAAAKEVEGVVEAAPAPVSGGAPLYIGDEVFGTAAPAASAEQENLAGTEQVSAAAPSGAASASVAETDEDAPLVFEADSEVKTPMNDEPEYSNDPKEFDETPLFFGDAENAPAEGGAGQPEEAATGSDEFVIPFASNDAPANATASADDVPQMPLYEAPTYVPPTYPTNSDTPVGYEDTGVYARGSYTVDEDEAAPSASPYVVPAPSPAPVSPFVNMDQPSFGGVDMQSSYDEPTQEIPPVPADYAYDAAYGQPEQVAAEPQYDFDNPPPAVADLFDFSTGPIAPDPQPQVSSVPAYMQQGEAVRPGSVPGVPRRPQQATRPGNRPNTQPARRKMDTIDDGFDNGDDEPGVSYLPFVLAAVSLICLIIIIVLIAKSCGSDKKKTTEATPSDTAITDISSDPSETETTVPPTTETTAPAPDAPIGVYTFSDKSGCRTWWDLFYHVYGIKIDSETDACVTTILTYNGKDSSYTPKAGDQIQLPPPDMLPKKSTT